MKKYFIGIALFGVSAVSAGDGDMLDKYIRDVVVKADVSSDPLLSLVEESRVKAESESKTGNLFDVTGVHAGDPNGAGIIEKAISRYSGDEAEVTSEPEIEAESENINESRVLRKELKDSALSMPEYVEESQIDKQLKQVLKRLGSLKLAPSGAGSQQEPVEEPVSLSDVAEPAEPVSEPNDMKAADSSIDEADEGDGVNIKLPENIVNVVDTFGLAESLFKTGDKARALVYYRKALERTVPDSKGHNPKRAWILFQVGNCLYNIDKDEALKAYEQLITEHASSEWTNCARTKAQILKWITENKPANIAGRVVVE